MRPRILVPFLAAALLAAALPALAQPGSGGQGRGQEDRPATPSPVPIGEFSVDPTEGRAEGEYVSFDYNASGLQNFTVAGVELFDLAVGDGGLGSLDGLRVKHAKLELKSAGLDLAVHDNPGAVTRISTDRPVALTFVEDATVRVSREGEQVAFSVGSVSGKFRGEQVVLDGQTVRARGEMLLILDSVRASFDSHRLDIVRAIERGHVGVEASFNKAGDDVEEDVISYGNVTMTRLRAEQGSLTVQVDGHGFDGRVLVLNVDGRLVGASRSEQLQVLFDNESIEEASTLADVLDPDDDGLKAEYYIVFDTKGEAFQLLVSVPHYSVHTLSIAGIVPLPAPSVVVGVVAGVLLLAPGAYVLFRRR